MGRLAYLLLITAVFGTGCYLGWLDLRAFASGARPAVGLIYGSLALIASAALLLVDFRRTAEAV
ncbi:MAG: hypothetical protein EOP21_11345 [Hyphomicrobiales bacterium]|nr:MAG: hypothetical protein EOP21_11345 [Hyphomicrobiales bacterium]